MRIEIPTPVLNILEKLHKCGYEAETVGGCVRDSLLGKNVHDWDICTSALPNEVEKALQGQKIIPTGLQHGTITVLSDECPVEVTTFRTDGTYSDARHPDHVRFVRSLQEDIARRDFTINAMAYSPESGLIDLYGGQNDLNRRLIRCVGNPNQRFQEDALRILRALRFASQLGFDIVPETEKAMRSESHLLIHLSAERIYSELCGLLTGVQWSKVLMQYGDIISVVLPEVRNRTWKKFRADLLEEDLIERWTAVFWGTEPAAAENAFRRLHSDGETRRTVCLLLNAVGLPTKTREDLLWALNRLGPRNMRRYANLLMAAGCVGTVNLPERLESVLSEKPCYKISGLEIDGSDLMKIGLKQGPEIGHTEELLLRDVIEQRCPNEKAALLKRAAEILRREPEKTNHENAEKAKS